MAAFFCLIIFCRISVLNLKSFIKEYLSFCVFSKQQNCMRPVVVQVPEGVGNKVIIIALKHDAKNLNLIKALSNDKRIDVVNAYLSNRKVENFIDELDSIEDVHITIHPQGVLALYPPQSQAPDQAVDVELRSPIEIFLSGLQSIGSWKGFLSYAVLTGIVVWIALYTNTEFLLVAAMLIAPFAGPAMNTAIATARGDTILLKNSLLRYFTAIAVTILISWFLTSIFDRNILTQLITERSKIPSTAILLALAAGAAGGINLIQSERDSLVSGAAVGMLVAASLAPPAGIIGIAAALNKWDIMISGIFLILLQLAGINFTGALVFRIAGLKNKGPRYNRGKNSISILSGVVTLLILISLTVWQFSTQVDFQRVDLSVQTAEDVKEIINSIDDLTVVDIQSKFTRTDTDEDILLLQIYILITKTIKETEILKQKLAGNIQEKIKNKKGVIPLVDIIFLKRE
jgi:uncharacterized hydrophobic protein (TIGR00271 family)